MSSPGEAPNEMKATFSRVVKRRTGVLDRAAGAFNSESLAAFKNRSFGIAPISEPFLGAWMMHSDKHKTMSMSELMRQQQLVQTLSETRFDALQRLLAFFVMFHAMGKTVADFWPVATCGVFGYDMSRSQSIMRVATTASPVSGMEVRERMLAIREDTRRIRAASSIQRIYRATRFIALVHQTTRRRRM